MCGKIQKVIAQRREASRVCQSVKSPDHIYEVSGFDGTRYDVGLKGYNCDSREWDASGISCKHAISAICSQGEDVEDYVHKCYSVEVYNHVYSHSVPPMNGEELWKKTGYIPPLPPNFGKRKTGRPKKKRRQGAGEQEENNQRDGGQTMPRKSYKVKCSFCKETGHNKKSCKMRKMVEDMIAEDMMAEEMTKAEDIPPMTQNTQDDNVDVSYNL